MPNKKRRRANRLKRRSEIQAINAPPDIFLAAAETDLTIQAVGEGETPREARAEIIAYTGGTLSLPKYPYPVVIDLAGVRAMGDTQMPLLRDHDPRRAVGHGTPTIGKDRLTLTGTLSVPGADRDAIISASQSSFQWQASIGGRVIDMDKNVQTIPKGKSVRVNGRVFAGPVHVVRAFLWKETSFVAVGADEGRASASVAASLDDRSNEPMNEFEKWLEANGIDSDNLNDTQLANLKAAWEATQDSGADTVTAGGNGGVEGGAPSGESVNLDRVVAAATEAALSAVRGHNERERRVDNLFATYADTSMSADERDRLRANVMSGEVSEDTAHLRLIQAQRSRGGTFSVHSGGGSSMEIQAMQLEASIARRAGLGEEDIHAMLTESGASQQQAERAVTESGRRPKGLKSLILAVCRQEGHHADEVDDDAIRCAMHASQRDLIMASSSSFSTVNVPGVLSRLANKAMLATYNESAGVATRIASTTATSDFKKFSRYRLTDQGKFEKVSAAGELKHGQFTEESYENQVETYGKIIALTRQMIRNDDLDAFLQIPRMLGRMARHALEEAVLTTLLNAPTAAGAGTDEFFHGAARGKKAPNYLEGASTNLSFDNLGTAYTLFLNQVDADGKPIFVSPELLLHNTTDTILAKKLYTDTQYRFTQADTRETINNQWAGMFEPVMSQYLHRLGATPLTKAWFLLARPETDMAALQIAFLDGRQTPIINTAETSFNTLGMQMRGYFDFGVALQDSRMIVKVKGEA